MHFNPEAEEHDVTGPASDQERRGPVVFDALHDDRPVGRPGARAWLSLALCTALLCSVAGTARADQTDERLPGLFERLATSHESGHSAVVESAIWQAWSSSGDAETDELFAAGVRAMGRGEMVSAIGFFNAVVLRSPDFSEGWNKRATALFYAGRHDDSMQDIQRVLSLEPRHFGAIAGMGLIFLERGDLQGALMAFEAVLKIHPGANHARQQAKQIRERLARQGA